MTIELPRDIESQIRQSAQARGLTVGEYVEALVSETDLRRAQVSEFSAAIAERMAALNTGDAVDGEEVMSRILADPAAG